MNNAATGALENGLPQKDAVFLWEEEPPPAKGAFRKKSVKYGRAATTRRGFAAVPAAQNGVGVRVTLLCVRRRGRKALSLINKRCAFRAVLPLIRHYVPPSPRRGKAPIVRAPRPLKKPSPLLGGGVGVRVTAL